MDRAQLMAQMKSCAVLLYQNKWQSAEQEIRMFLPQMNEVLQKKGAQPEEEERIIPLIRDFLAAYQRQDALALADLLDTELMQVIE